MGDRGAHVESAVWRPQTDTLYVIYGFRVHVRSLQDSWLRFNLNDYNAHTEEL